MQHKKISIIGIISCIIIMMLTMCLPIYSAMAADSIQVRTLYYEEEPAEIELISTSNNNNNNIVPGDVIEGYIRIYNATDDTCGFSITYTNHDDNDLGDSELLDDKIKLTLKYGIEEETVISGTIEEVLHKQKYDIENIKPDEMTKQMHYIVEIPSTLGNEFMNATRPLDLVITANTYDELPSTGSIVAALIGAIGLFLIIIGIAGTIHTNKKNKNTQQ